MRRAVINKTKEKRNTNDNGTEREHAAQRALPILCCPPAVKRLKSYFEFRTVGLILHNNVLKAMAVAWPIGARLSSSWAYWRVSIGRAAWVYHSIC